MRESTSAGGETALIKIDVYFESVQKGPTRKKRLPAALVISRELPKCLLQPEGTILPSAARFAQFINNITPTATRFTLRKCPHWVSQGKENDGV